MLVECNGAAGEDDVVVMEENYPGTAEGEEEEDHPSAVPLAMLHVLTFSHEPELRDSEPYMELSRLTARLQLGNWQQRVVHEIYAVQIPDPTALGADESVRTDHSDYRPKSSIFEPARST